MKHCSIIQVCYLLWLCGLYACASMGSPGGGNYDLEPPKFVRSDPAPRTIHYEKNKIALWFDEYISLEKPSETVIITPPQQKMPVIKALGKKISVELKDSLLPDVTYTFDFTNGIVDNNEKNALEGFTFAFATGGVIDSLIISGILLNAENLEPTPNTMVGVHSNLSDTAFTKIPFLRTSQTNERGQFWIRNIAPGTYRLFALSDLNRNFRFDQQEEAIAFYDSLIVPSFESAVRMDTVWKDSLRVDSIREIAYTRFTPDNVILRLFKEDFAFQYLSKNERSDARQFSLIFNTSVDQLPSVDILDEAEKNTEWYLLEQSPDRKILTYWLTDSTLYQKDTLRIRVNYLEHDTLKNMINRTDTLRMIHKKNEAPKDKDKDKKKSVENKTDFLGISITPFGATDVFDTVKIIFSEPLADFPREKLQIRQKVDTVWETRNFPIRQDTLNPRIYYLDYPLPYEQEYQICIDSAALTTIYGKRNDSIGVNLKIRAESDYAQLIIALSGNENVGFGQLLDNNEKIVKTASLYEGELFFYDIKPGKYFLRYIEDENGNGQWDAGNYAENRQPEKVYYYPTFFELKAFMEMEQHWSLMERSTSNQKPLEILKNKPKEKQQPKRDNSKQNDNRGNSNQPALLPEQTSRQPVSSLRF